MIDRLVGTIGGAGWGIASRLGDPASQRAFDRGLATRPLRWCRWAAGRGLPAELSHRARWTAAIVLLAYSDQTGVIQAALDRVFEIGLGSARRLFAVCAAGVAGPRAHDPAACGGSGCPGG